MTYAAWNRSVARERPPAESRSVSVSRLNQRVRRALSGAFRPLWVTGEISGFSRSEAGHCYFKLKDRFAQVDCVMFRSDALRLFADPESGTPLECFARVELYEKSGRYQLVVQRLRTLEGEGLHKAAYDRLRRKLEAEGLTDPSRKRPLPRRPATIGLVTSKAGAAIRDVTSTLSRRAPWIRLLVRDAPVQGAGAALRLAKALRIVGEASPDLILLVRGGGDQQDLWCFNEEPLARAVAASPVPIISGVGHETDVTICDLVADLRAATPTAAAEAAVESKETIWRRVGVWEKRLAAAVQGRARLGRERLGRLEDRAARAGTVLADRHRARVEDAGAAMTFAMTEWKEALARRLESGATKLNAISPLATLKRGYAVPLDGLGRVLRSVSAFPPERTFKLRVVDGEVQCVSAGPARS